ncbi:MAG: tetratricopeptide repeat protein [Candidatus Marinimicrobia bacterium]|nr:tetratricopeptide repeat protein [Candidatus Neomarinimicrobiota bacterium]
MMILLISFLTLFVFISRLKEDSYHKIPEEQSNGKTVVEKERIQRFWDVYRQAAKYRIAGKPDEAAGKYLKAIELNNQHEDALYYLGNMYVELDEFEAAEQTWKHLIKVNPSSTRAHVQLGMLYLLFPHEALFNIDAAETEFQRALAINKEATTPLLRLGQIELIRGNLFESQRLLDAVIRSNQRSVESHFLRGYIDWKRKNPQKALTFLLKAGENSRPLATVQDFSGEGDTKTGHITGLSGNRGMLFDVFFENLSDLKETDFSQEMYRRYRKLDMFLEQIRKKNQNGNET